MAPLLRTPVREIADWPVAEPRVIQGRQTILIVLERAARETEFQAQMADDPAAALAEYYTLSKEERAALASGDIARIEQWVGKLEPRLASWLWARLGQEKW